MDGRDRNTWYLLGELQGATLGNSVYNTQRIGRWESKLRLHGLEGHDEEAVFNVAGKWLKALDLMITLVDQFIHFYKCTVSTVGDTF